jgi:hypothetical protein
MIAKALFSMLSGFLLVLVLALALGWLFSASEGEETEDERPWRNHVLGWFGKDPSEPSKEKMLPAVQREIEINKKYSGRLASVHNDALQEDVCLRLPTLGRDLLGQEGVAFREVPGQSVRTLPKDTGLGEEMDETRTRLDSLSKIGFFRKSETVIDINPAQVIPAVRYHLTQKGYVNLLPDANCLNVGKRMFDSIETITRTDNKVDDSRVYEVSYRLRVERAAWSNAPEILQAFPELVNVWEDRFAVVKLLQGDDGWIPMSEKKLELQKELATLNLESGEKRDEFQAGLLRMEARDFPETPSNEKLLNMLQYPENASSQQENKLKNACLPLPPLLLGSGDGARGKILQDVQDNKPVFIYFDNAMKRSERENNRINILDALYRSGFAEREIIFGKKLTVPVPLFPAKSGGEKTAVSTKLKSEPDTGALRYAFKPDTVKYFGLDSYRGCVPLGTIKPSLISVVPQGLTELKATLWATIDTPSAEAKRLARTLPAIRVALDEGYPIFATVRLTEERGLKPFWKFSGNARHEFPEIKYTEFPDSIRHLLSPLFGNASSDDIREERRARYTQPPAPVVASPPPMLPDGAAGLREALARNLVRYATHADFAAWSQARLATKPESNPQRLTDEPTIIRAALLDNRAYVVLKPLRYPAGLYGAHAAIFLISRGVSAPVGDSGHSTVFNLNNLTVCRYKCGDASY